MSDISSANGGPLSTETTTREVEEYCDAVRDALTDLPAEARDDLLEDLADHLAEVSAEGEGSLRERLGEPAAYALDLRAAAGYDAPPDPTAGVHDKISAAVRRSAAVTARADLRLGRLVGYPRLSQLVRALAPGWWVLRGWIVAQLVCADRSGEFSFSPAVGNSRLVGGAITLAIVVVSVLVGRSTVRWSSWPRRAAYAASVAVAIWGVVVLAPFMIQTQYTIETVPADSSSYSGVGDVYVYDQNGNLVPNARIYDDSGNPLRLGVPDCSDGGRGVASNAIDPTTDMPASNDWTYPLCPNNPHRPFQSGPGAIVPSDSASSSSAPTTVPTGAPPATSSAPLRPTTPATAASSTTP